MKTETIPFRQFMANEKAEIKIKDILEKFNDKKVKTILAGTTTAILLANGIPFATLPLVLAHAEAIPVASAVPESIKMKILHAFDPLIDVIQALSYPIAAIMITTGCLFIMVNNKEKGMSLIQGAGIGYILVQLAPVFMQILVGIGGAV